jgi:hypothetical protein
LRQRRLRGVADETFNVGERFRHMRRQAPRTGKETKVCLWQPDQVVAILGNTKIARERELEGTGSRSDGRARAARITASNSSA